MEENSSAAEVVEPVTQSDVRTATEAITNNKQPEEVAAMLCTMYLPAFRAHVAKLSNNALRRLIYNLVQYPLESDYNPRNTVEKNAFLIGDRLLSSKYMMIISTFMQSEQANNALKNAANEAAQAVEPKQGEETNV